MLCNPCVAGDGFDNDPMNLKPPTVDEWYRGYQPEVDDVYRKRPYRYERRRYFWEERGDGDHLQVQKP